MKFKATSLDDVRNVKLLQKFLNTQLFILVAVREEKTGYLMTVTQYVRNTNSDAKPTLLSEPRLPFNHCLVASYILTCTLYINSLRYFSWSQLLVLRTHEKTLELKSNSLCSHHYL